MTRERVLALLISALFVLRHIRLSWLAMWPGFMLMSGKLSEKRLPDVAGYHTAMEVGRTSHSLPPFGFPHLRLSQSHRYFRLFSLRVAISLEIQCERIRIWRMRLWLSQNVPPHACTAVTSTTANRCEIDASVAVLIERLPLPVSATTWFLFFFKQHVEWVCKNIARFL